MGCQLVCATASWQKIPFPSEGLLRATMGTCSPCLPSLLGTDLSDPAVRALAIGEVDGVVFNSVHW